MMFVDKVRVFINAVLANFSRKVDNCISFLEQRMFRRRVQQPPNFWQIHGEEVFIEVEALADIVNGLDLDEGYVSE